MSERNTASEPCDDKRVRSDEPTPYPLLLSSFSFKMRLASLGAAYAVFKELFDLQLFSDKHREAKEIKRKKKDKVSERSELALMKTSMRATFYN